MSDPNEKHRKKNLHGLSTLNSPPSALTGENPRIKASAAPRLLIPSDLSPVKALGSEFNVYLLLTVGQRMIRDCVENAPLIIIIIHHGAETHV